MSKSSARVKNEARHIALLIVYDVVERGAYANLSLDKHMARSKLTVEDRHLVTEIVNGTIRMLKHLDWVLNAFLPKLVAEQNPWLRSILRISVYQMLFMERVPDYAVVDSAVDLANARLGSKLGGVVNGVLRSLARNREKIVYPDEREGKAFLSVYYSQPAWLVEMWLSDYGPEATRDMLAYLNQSPRVTLRNNQLTGSRDELQAQLRGEGVSTDLSPQTPWSLVVTGMDASLGSLQSYREGRFYVQNEGSMLAVAILDPHPGEHLIDLCSGVGGKATFMAEMMHDQGRVDAIELYPHKVSLLKDNCSRLRISSVTAHQRDILQLSPGDFMGSGVLLDAPCSGLGVLNRRADMRWRRTREEIQDLSRLQAGLLQVASDMVQPGGRLVYTTCTVDHLENQAVIKSFLGLNGDFCLEDFSSQLEFFPLDEGDRYQAGQGMLCLLPGKYQTDGMFFARMRRSGYIQDGN
ncbi:MAG: 16S rRNA (cytosine(967)-C(5))-methyltransferase RsmB [Syntrophomonadaceae bacterium]|nr:16S rRNA (cytosine(967)-C(5))-methyltransferase RsmB [Syntrophomonadaceae bacterium]